MTNDLTERVARLYEDAWGIKDHWRARQAIAIALHEAAKVAVLTINSRPELTSYDVWLAICDLIPSGNDTAQDGKGSAE
jgi:hypothetical protein